MSVTPKLQEIASGSGDQKSKSAAYGELLIEMLTTNPPNVVGIKEFIDYRA